MQVLGIRASNLLHLPQHTHLEASGEQKQIESLQSKKERMEIKRSGRRKSKRDEENRGHGLPFALSFCVVVSKHIEIIKNFGILRLGVPSCVVSVFFHSFFSVIYSFVI